MQPVTPLPKPKIGQPCNGCGFCCTIEPCKLAQELLNCTSGPCVALEFTGNTSGCGLVRNPLAYLFKAANPDVEVDLLGDPPPVAAGFDLSVKMAAALGIGHGCDADDDESSALWGCAPSDLIPTKTLG